MSNDGENLSPQQPQDRPKPRLVCPQRQSVRVEVVVDDLLEADHPARAIWVFVEHADLSELLAKIRSVEHHPGSPVHDPRVYLALWIYAFSQGVGSARLLDELCQTSVAYQWLCGGVSVNYHSLADFLTHNEALVDGLIARILGILMFQGLVSMDQVAQDGVRVRASAGSHSFHREQTVDQYIEQARQQIQALRAELHDGQARTRQQAARERAARERLERLENAKLQFQLIKAKQQASNKAKEKNDPPEQPPGDSANDQDKSKQPQDPEQDKEPRVSTTDPEARRMKMADGGTRPAYNVQLVTETEGLMIVEAAITNAGNDYGQIPIVQEQLFCDYHIHPKRLLADGNCNDAASVRYCEKNGIELYSPPRKPLDELARTTLWNAEQQGTLSWRERMQTPQAQEIYKQRAGSAEWANAQLRNHGLRQFVVRGMNKALAYVKMLVLAVNLRTVMRMGWFKTVLSNLSTTT